jgi:glycosidase
MANPAHPAQSARQPRHLPLSHHRRRRPGQRPARLASPRHLPRCPSIYYGDEIGLTGALPDHWARKTFPWGHPERWDLDALAFHKTLIALRRAHPPLQTGGYTPLRRRSAPPVRNTADQCSTDTAHRVTILFTTDSSPRRAVLRHADLDAPGRGRRMGRSRPSDPAAPRDRARAVP